MAEEKGFTDTLRDWMKANPKITEFAETLEIERGGITYEFSYYPAVEGLAIFEKVRGAIVPALGSLAGSQDDPMAMFSALIGKFPTSTVTSLAKLCLKYVHFRGNGLGAQRVAGNEEDAFGHVKRGRIFLYYEVLIRSLAVNLIPPM